MLPRSPIPAAAGFLAAGLLAPAGLRAPAPISAAIALVALIAGIRAALRCAGGLDARRPIPAAALLIPIAFLPLGWFLAGACELARRPDNVALLLARDPALRDVIGTLEGSVGEEPRPWAAPEGGCTIAIDLIRMDEGRLSRPATGRVRLALPAAPPSVDEPCLLVPGTRLRLAASLSLPRSFANPGALDYPGFLRARGIDALARSPSSRLVTILERPPRLRLFLSRTRRAILRAIDRAFAEAGSADGGSISSALLLGVRDGIPAEDERTFQRSGTSHLLAVSGFNVAVLAGALLLAARIAGLSTAIRSIFLVPALAGYLLLTEGEPSVERAVLGALLVLAAIGIGRKPDPLGLTACVGLLLAAASPMAIHDVSFQLTFIATAALASRAGALAARIPGPRWIASSLAVDLVALGFTAPVTAFLFNRVTPGALLANLVASPLMALAFLIAGSIPAAVLLTRGLGAAGILLSPALSPSVLLARAGALSIELTLRFCRAVAEVPGLSYVCVTPAPWIVGISLIASFLPSIFREAPAALRRALAAAAVVSSILCLLPGERPGPARALAGGDPAPEGALRITVLDVGQGSSALVETPLGARLLVDAGGFGGSTFDVGARVVARTILTMGLRRLDAIAASHEDFDHVGGIPGVLDIFPGGELWISATDHAGGRLRGLEALAVDSGRALRLNARGMRIALGGAVIDLLHPARGEISTKDNDLCQVLRIEALGRSILLAGDVESAAEREIAPLLEPTDVLVVPHHGSRTSSTPDLLHAARPALGLISCGYANRFKHPHPEALARLRSAGVEILRTDLDGALRVTCLPAAGRKATMKVERFSDGEWRSP
jgi:competence protein ComEC